MALGAALVDRARVVEKIASGVKVEGRTQMARVEREWFRARLFLGSAPEAMDEGNARRKKVARPTLLFGVRDVTGQPIEVRGEVEVEVDSRELGRSVWRVSGDPEPLRKKRTVIGWQAQLERLVEPERPGVTA